MIRAKVNRTNTTVRQHSLARLRFFDGGQRPGKQPFFGSDYGGGGDAWNLTVINIHADVPVVRWSRVNISLHGNGWTPAMAIAMHMRVRGLATDAQQSLYSEPGRRVSTSCEGC